MDRDQPSALVMLRLYAQRHRIHRTWRALGRHHLHALDERRRAVDAGDHERARELDRHLDHLEARRREARWHLDEVTERLDGFQPSALGYLALR